MNLIVVQNLPYFVILFCLIFSPVSHSSAPQTTKHLHSCPSFSDIKNQISLRQIWDSKFENVFKLFLFQEIF